MEKNESMKTKKEPDGLYDTWFFPFTKTTKFHYM